MMKLSGFKTYICAGTVALISNELSESDRQDALDALLYSQTVASRKFPDFADSEPWINASRTAMKTLGAMLFSEPGIHFPAPEPGCFTLAALAENAIRQMACVDAEQALRASLKALSRQSMDSPESALLHAHILQDQKHIQFKFCVISPGVSTVFASLSFAFDDAVEGNILRHAFNHEKVIGNVSIAGFKAWVEDEDFDLSRETIIGLLGAMREQQVIELT